MDQHDAVDEHAPLTRGSTSGLERIVAPSARKTAIITLGAVASAVLNIVLIIALLAAIILVVEQRAKHSHSLQLTCAVDSEQDSKLIYSKAQMLADSFQADMHKEIRANVIKELLESTSSKPGMIYVRGVKEESETFRQDRNFLYLSGINWPGYEFLIDLVSQRAFILAPHIAPMEAVWNLPYIPTLEQLKTKFGVEAAYYSESLSTLIENYKPQVIYTVKGQDISALNTTITIDSTTLTNLLITIRAVKTDKEIQVMRYANKVSSAAHIDLMKRVKPSLWEYQLEALFLFKTDGCGLRKQAYAPICGSGRNTAVLHYVDNDRQLKPIDTKQVIPEDLVLIDAGAEFLGYSSDITRTYPSNGVFTPEQADVYQAVLNVQMACIEALKPNIPWNSIVALSQKTMLLELQKLNFISKSASIDMLMNATIYKLFQPHGLGHLLGLDVHDTSVYPQNLLLPNMLITIEPGIYFHQFLFEGATEEQKKLLNMNKIKDYYNFGGIRIEDDVLITQTGYEVITQVPKTVQEIQHIKIL